MISLCLAKDPDERWQTVHDVKLELQGIRERLGTVEAGVPVQRSASRMVWGLAAALALASAGLVYFASQNPRGVQQENAPKQLFLQFTPPPVVKGFLFPPDGFAFSPYMYALSPDGKKIAFVATSDAKPKGILFVQKLDSATATPLPGIEDVADSGYPFWSPDNTAIGFFSGGKLKRVDANGGVPIYLADAEDPHGGAWSRDGVIVFTRSGARRVFDNGAPRSIGSDTTEFLYRVPETGGMWRRSPSRTISICLICTAGQLFCRTIVICFSPATLLRRCTPRLAHVQRRILQVAL